MGFGAFAAIAIVSIVAGYAVQRLMARKMRYEWLLVTLSAAFGAYFFSETIVGSSIFGDFNSWGPVADGMYIVPAIVGGILFAAIVELGIRTGDRQSIAA